MRTRFRLAGAAAGAALLLAACGGVPADVAATVGGEPIPVDQVESLVRLRLQTPQFQELPAQERVVQTDTLQQQVVANLVTQHLLRIAAEERGVEPGPEEIQEAWELQVAGIGGEEALPQALADAGLTEEQARAQVVAGLRQQKLQASFEEEVEVTEADIRELYEQRRPQLEEVTTAHILVEAEEEADEIVRLLEEGADFNELAAERSTDPSAAQNQGELGSVAVGQLVPEYVEPLRDAEPGEIVGPVQSQFGWHVIRFDEFSAPELEEVRDQLRAELAGGQSGQGFNAYVTDLLERVEVDVNSRFGEWDPSTGTVAPPEGVGTGGQPRSVLPGAADGNG